MSGKMNRSSMTYKSLRLCIIISSMILICRPVIYSQPVKYVSCKIINSRDLKPVPFATVSLKNSQLGVFANAEGDFKLLNSPKFQSDSLVITCIGFKRHSVAYKELNISEVNKIWLTPDIYGLAEVKVTASKRRISSITIIGRAIRNIRNNYPVIPFNYISYYRDYQKKGEDYLNLNEAIVQTLDTGFSSLSTGNRYRLLDYRKNLDFTRINLSPFYDTVTAQKGNSSDKTIPSAVLGDQFGNEIFILLVHDAIRNYNARSFSFVEKFSENFLENHDFSDPVAVYNNDLLLYRIDFKVKPRITDDSLLISGAIFIQPKDYSIHKLEYSCSYIDPKKVKKEVYGVNIEYGYQSSAGSLMRLKYISFNNLFVVTDTSDYDLFRIKESSLFGGSPSGIVFVTTFNHEIDVKSASEKKNYEIIIGKKKAKIDNIKVERKKVFVTIKNDRFTGIRDSSYISIRNVKDINGKVLNKAGTIELHQYRELFVQEYNKTPAFTDSCYMQYRPLDQNCISKSVDNSRYWMNSPEKIEKISPGIIR
jgi:hypothetical protein